MVKKRLINVDFQKLERGSYRSMSALCREIIDKMIQANEETEDDLNDYQRVLLDAVKESFKALTKRQKEVLAMKFGLDGKEAKSQVRIAESLGITKQTVNRIYGRAIKKLKNMIKLNENVVKSIKLKKS